jgi:hypothetical protein
VKSEREMPEGHMISGMGAGINTTVTGNTPDDIS